MKTKIKQFLQINKIKLFIIIASILFCSYFVAHKEGYHMDEILAYQLSNAQFNPWIVPTQPEGRLAKFYDEYIQSDTVIEQIQNVVFILKDTLEQKENSILSTYTADVYDAPVWIENTTFQDYIQVSEEDAFNLLSVYFNVKDDNHPPLHFMLLHIASSIWQGENSIWIGCSINLIAMIGILWLIGNIGDILFEQKMMTYAAMLLFGFSTAAISMALWTRMYTLLAFFLMGLIYLHIKGLEQGFDKQYKGIVGFTLCAFWTQYFSLFLILPLALTTVIILMQKKQTKEAIQYTKRMVIAGIIGVMIYPFSVVHILFSGRGQEAISQWSNGWLEYIERVKVFGQILAHNILLHEALLILLLVLGIVVLCSKKIKGSTAIKICWIPTILYFLLAAKMSPYFVDRYIMAIFPITVCIGIYILERLGTLVTTPKVKKIYSMAIVLSVLLIVTISTVQKKGSYAYLYQGYDEHLEVAKRYQEYPMVCFYDGYGFYENVLEMEQYAQTLLVKEAELEQLTEETKAELDQGYILLIKYAGTDQGINQLETVMQALGGSKVTLLLESTCFQDVIYLVE